MKKNYIFILLITVCLTSVNAQENALNFDGDNDYVELGTNSLFDITSTISLEAWVFPTQYANENNVITKFGDVPFQDSYILRLANGQAQFHLRINSNWFIVAATSALNLNTWTHVAGVYDGASMKIFINGVLNNSISQTGNIEVSPSTLKIGKWASVDSFHGNIDEVRIWNIARSNSEISSNYNLALTGNESGLVIYYRFNQGTANGNNSSETTLTDLSVNNINGTLNNFQLSGTNSNWVGGIDFSTLSLSENYFNFTNVKIYPNPSNDIILISGLNKTENYKIYNIFGSKINQGNISNLEKIDIKKLANGQYFLKFENGDTIKFIKE